MTTPYALGTAAAAVVIAISLAACGDDPPAGPSNEVMRVEINGPASIAPGQTASFSVIEYLSNGTSRALPTATWTSSNTSVIQVTNSGVATAQPRNGEAVITVRTTRQASKEVLVLPAGTFRLVGQVTDADQFFVPIPDASIAVLGGSATTTTNPTGNFRLYGVPGDAEIEVAREGYRVLRERIQLTTHATRNFRMAVDSAARNLAGNYTLVVEAGTNCGSPALKNELRRRSYDAIIVQDGAKLEVRLTEPRFVSSEFFPGDRFSGSVTPAGANFTVNWEYYSALTELSERLSDDSVLTISGSATTTGTSAGLTGVFSGYFAHASAGSVFIGGCPASRLSLTRR
jgi:hypothetical protein